MTRRTFLNQAALGALAAASTVNLGHSAEPEAKKGEVPLIVSTWPFGKASNDAALKILLGGGSLLDAVEQGIWVTESAGDGSVGLSGSPNAAGVVQLDACIMNGPDHKAGSVAGLEGIRHPISAARRVMEKTKHVLLVGEGARMFALEEGLESVELNSREKYDQWQKQRAAQKTKPAEKKPDNHDTIALLVLGANGNIAGGLLDERPGRQIARTRRRLADHRQRPLCGQRGRGGRATGIGENVMRYCASFLIVEFMRQGMSPQEACVKAIRRIIQNEPKGANLSINFVALDKQGRYGAAGTDGGFQYSVTMPGSSRVLPNPGIGIIER